VLVLEPDTVLVLEPDTVLALEPGIVLHSLPDQEHFFAFSVTTGDEFHMNQTSFWVLEAVGEGVKWGQLKKFFLDSFDVAPQQGESDLLVIVDKFKKGRIIRRQDDGEKEA